MLLDTIFGGAINAGIGAINNAWARDLQHEAREENYKLGEKAAENADKRTRALYKDFYSPEALLRQYKEAGLSPSMMFGGTPGQGGTSGAQGSGAQGPGAVFSPMSLLEGAQMANLAASTEKTKAETEKTKAEKANIEEDTTKKELENAITNLNLIEYQNAWEITNSTWKDPTTGNDTSLFELADKHYNYESFLNAIRNTDTDNLIKRAATTEAGQKVLRSIYESSSKFHRDIAVLSEEEVNAHFQMEIVKKLEEKEFQNLNAEAAVQQLRQEISTNELTQTQKEAWNNLINRLGKKGSTMRDVVVVLGMILGNFASHSGIKLNLGGK